MACDHMEHKHHLTDAGNAGRFVNRHGDNMRYVHEHGCWYIWNGNHWEPDTSGLIYQGSLGAIRETHKHAVDCKDESRSDLMSHALRSESKARQNAMVEMAAHEPGITVSLDMFDRDPWVLNFPNGTLDLRTFEFRKHRREDYITKITGAPYDGDARSERWSRFLQSTFPDPEVRGYVQRLIGSSLIGTTDERILPILYGTGSNGKGVLLETTRKAFGDYACWPDADAVLEKGGSTSFNEGVARMRGARFIGMSETEQTARLNINLVKKLTGGDEIETAYKYGHNFSFSMQGTIFLATNHKPRVTEQTHAAWSRLRLVPFTQTFEPDNGGLKRDLRSEPALMAVLLWAIEGCREYQENGLDEPEEIRRLTKEYQEDQDYFGQFLKEECVFVDGARVAAKTLHDTCRRWYEDHGERPPNLSLFGRLMAERPMPTNVYKRHTMTGTVWENIGLRSSLADNVRQLPGGDGIPTDAKGLITVQHGKICSGCSALAYERDVRGNAWCSNCLKTQESRSLFPAGKGDELQ